ncbi:glycoside hydrolase [Lasiosphaeria hispida]|uniref:lytic cellulose monooxygenase (C4-dehydrogenating) n=1 Tax=Lasiosphaeria hispida TaxID=260671 RepID=A0AAJ0MFB8_9PEZI|nr:glycoside hydrolase [Lasiosphaeria hispida]
MALALAILLLGISSLADAHGFLKNVQVNGKTYPAWQVGQDDFVKPPPLRYVRKLKDNGAVPDFTSKDITCGVGGNIPAEGIIELKAGDKVQMIWDQWGSSHSGPVMRVTPSTLNLVFNTILQNSYLAHCTDNDCKSFKGDSGKIWVKIEQLSYNPSVNPAWASDLLRVQGAKWTVAIPPKLAPGEYLLRHEILGLHVADKRMGAQFYPSCTQIRVTQGGTAQLPEGVAFPGAYSPDDGQGILTPLWKVQQGLIKYVAPGGEVWAEAAPNANRAGP